MTLFAKREIMDLQRKQFNDKFNPSDFTYIN